MEALLKDNVSAQSSELEKLACESRVDGGKASDMISVAPGASKGGMNITLNDIDIIQEGNYVNYSKQETTIQKLSTKLDKEVKEQGQQHVRNISP